MGTNYEADIKCAYCGKLNEGVWYAPSSEKETFKCKFCKRDNNIVLTLKAEKRDKFWEEGRYFTKVGK